MLPFARMLEYGNIAPVNFSGVSKEITYDSTGYNAPGRNNTASCSPNIPDYPYIYFYGGITGTSTYLNDFFYYNTSDNKFYQISSGNIAALRACALTYANDGYIYGWGGANSSNSVVNQLFRHRVGSSTIEVITNDTARPQGRYNHAGVCIGNEIYYFGGHTDAAREVIVAYNYITRSWRTIRSGITTPTLNVEPSSVIVFNSLVYIIIGQTLYTFNPANNAFIQETSTYSPVLYNSGFIIVDEMLYNITGAFVTKRQEDGRWVRIASNPVYASYTWYGYVYGKLEAYTLFGGGANTKSAIMYKFT